MASHAGSRLLTDLAEVTGLTQALSRAVGQRRRRRSAHDPGRVLVDLAVIPAATAGGPSWPGLRLVVDATLVTCHGDKELASPTCQGRLRLPPADRLAGQHQRGAGGSAASWQRGVQHHRRPRRGDRPGAGPAPG